MAYDSREHLMSTPMNEFEEPQTLPNGQYIGQIVRHEWTTVGERNTDALDYYCQVVEPGADIDASDINGVDLREHELRVRFFITKKAMYRLRQFHTSLGFDPSLPADSVLPETTGMKVLMTVTTTSSTRNGRTRQFNNVDEAVGIPS